MANALPSRRQRPDGLQFSHAQRTYVYVEEFRKPATFWAWGDCFSRSPQRHIVLQDADRGSHGSRRDLSPLHGQVEPRCKNATGASAGKAAQIYFQVQPAAEEAEKLQIRFGVPKDAEDGDDLLQRNRGLFNDETVDRALLSHEKEHRRRVRENAKPP